MTMKPKRRKPAAAPKMTIGEVQAAIAKHQAGHDKISEAGRFIWDGINFLKLIELAADKTIEERDNADDYAHAICAASRVAIERIMRADELIDEAGFEIIDVEVASPAEEIE